MRAERAAKREAKAKAKAAKKAASPSWARRMRPVQVAMFEDAEDGEEDDGEEEEELDLTESWMRRLRFDGGDGPGSGGAPGCGIVA